MKPLHLKDIISFILENRYRSKAICKDWTVNQISNLVVDSMKTKSFFVDTDENNNILGVAICEPIVAYKLLYVHILLTRKDIKGVVPRMLCKFKELYSGWDIQACRKELEIRYKNTNRLCNLLNKLT